MKTPLLSNAQWQQFEREGFLRLGKVLSDSELFALQTRIDDIMLGRADVDYDQMLMQLDKSAPLPPGQSNQTRGFKGATLAYRKIQELEFDPQFRAYMEKPIFREICARAYGENTPINAYRAMFMNKPAGQGSFLQWHQDRWHWLDRDPIITIWTALDPATVANGCVQVIPRSHKLGLINPDNPSGFLTDEQVPQFAPEDKVEFMELEAGEAVLLHNWTLHASEANFSRIARRAFSVCYMDGRTQTTNKETYSRIFEDVVEDAPITKEAVAVA